MPETIPLMDESFFHRLPDMNLPQIAFEVGSKYVGDEIPASTFKSMCNEAFDFPIYLKQISERKYVLELFHGPTAAFKDFGARFMSQCFKYFSENDDLKTVVLVATSGDTGGAIANSFLGIDGVDVIILYPSGKVSDIQEQQLTTLGKNITALEVEGTFDDCQALVKMAFNTMETYNKIRLTSANSINIARLIPQSFYYYFAVSQLKNDKPVISVPSGNFGNITGALLAWKTGLPVNRFIASTNINKIVPDYLESGKYNPRKSIQTIANAMDVGNPSNFDRLLEIFGGEWDKVNAMISGYWFTDDQIKQLIENEFKKSGYILDPHGAVASLGLEKYLQKNPELVGIVVETAHPAKFLDVVQPLIAGDVSIPKSLKECLTKTKESVAIKPEFRYLERFLKDKYYL
jgi:threonine synthase